MRRLPTTIDRFIQYGVSNELAKKASGVNLTVSSARGNSRKVLVEKFGLSAEEADAIKIAVVREPIPDDCVGLLLHRSNFTCNVCKGMKSISFIIHHIVPYEQSRNNNDRNLVVLCPACHDFAHRSGLTLGITEKQLRESKSSWENQVLQENVRRAAQQIEVRENAIDYVNIRRIEELCVRHFNQIPDTSIVGFSRFVSSFPVEYRRGLLRR